jgi:phosphatidylglycerol:prolipoprotein diacylglycerol transferase
MDTSIAFSLGPLTIRWYGILVALAFAVGSYLAYREVRRLKLDVDELMNMLIVIIPSSIIGARLYYVVMRWEFYGQNPAYILRIWEGGLAVHGGIIAAVLAVFLYCRRRKHQLLVWLDLLMPSLAIGQAIGRWGNFFNQEAYGYETSLPWAMYIDGAYRHPTFLYESLWNVLIFALLFILSRRRHQSGALFALYLIAYSVGRFFIEMLRTDSLMIGPLRAAMVISVLGLLAGLATLYFIRRQPLPQEGRPAPGKKAVSRQQQRAEQRDVQKKQGKKHAK